MRIVLAPDKFKGSLSASEAAEAIGRGIHQILPEAILDSRPIADGGEGFAKALAPKSTASLNVQDALGRLVSAEYGWLDSSTAVIEMSAASGLWRIGIKERSPLHSSTFGTGELIADAIARSASRIIVGLGGSATNDGGAGMAAALGYEFLDSEGNALRPIPAELPRVNSIKPPVAGRVFPPVLAACDVDNPLLGAQGATRIYGPQKGAAPGDLDFLEAAMLHLANLVARDLGCDYREVPGAGAAGGLGFGLMSFCGAEIRSGFDLVAEATGLEQAIAASDLVITGEGKIDSQTFRGKGPAGVAALARKHRKPVIAFTGALEEGTYELGDLFDAVYTLKDRGISLEESMRHAAILLANVARVFCEARFGVR